MKKILILLVTSLLISCASIVPKNAESIEKQIVIEHDSFSKKTWIKSPLYLSRQGFTDTFPVNLSYRASFKNNELEFIQLYVTASNITWGFYHSANGEDGVNLKLVNVDSFIDSGAGIVTTIEHFGISLDLEYIEKMTAKDFKIKVYGKRNEGVFIVPKALSKAFYNKLNCFQSNRCVPQNPVLDM